VRVGKEDSGRKMKMVREYISTVCQDLSESWCGGSCDCLPFSIESNGQVITSFSYINVL
jgi:hypothetical protein